MRELIAFLLGSLFVLPMIVALVALVSSFVFNYAASRHRKPTLAWWCDSPDQRKKDICMKHSSASSVKP